MSHEWNCQCDRCVRDRAWEADTLPDVDADEERERYERGGETVTDAGRDA
jgi:hypothetical protein